MESDTHSGTLALLFTDIEGSTKLWEQEPERMPIALARHDALVRGAVAAEGGTVVKMIGDGTQAVFDDPLHAVSAALRIQQDLADPISTAGLALSVRCGLHWGAVQMRDNDYFGSAVNLAARITGLAFGGQVLVSQAVADTVIARVLPGTSLRDLGEVRLKGLAATERVYQIVHPQLRQDFPALRSLETTPNNLPQQLTSFIGRERDLAEATARLQCTRLLTLLGMGGLGKTRLALRIGADALDDFPDGVWFVDLAPIQDPSLVPAETARVLGLREEPGTSLDEVLETHLKSRKLLLILDNCEHLIDASANLATALLRAAPDLRIVATSREVLQVPGEQTYPVLPLEIPALTDELATLLGSAAVQLFVERARQRKRSFSLSERDAPALAELVARLEGIPLAIELAAARVPSLAVADINARLKDRYKLLTGGGRPLLERQQTLRALVDWSYNLLRDNERTLLAHLGVFAGGFDLAAAEAVCGTEPLAAGDIVDLLASLVDKSLVVPEDGDSGIRYRMLETIRDYARIKLVERDQLEAVSSRHCDYFFVMAKDGNRNTLWSEHARWVGRLEAEHDNMRAAIAFALLGGGDPIIAAKIEVALQTFRILRGYVTEGRRNVRALLALPAIQSMDIAQAYMLYVGACLANSQGENKEAEWMLEACLTLRRGIGNQSLIAATLSTLAVVRRELGDSATAREEGLEALATFRREGDRYGEAIVLSQLGGISAHTNNDEEAGHFQEQSLAIARELGHQEIESGCERALGDLALERADIPAARARFERALAICRAASNKRGMAITLWHLGTADIACGDIAAARPRLNEALRSFQVFQMSGEIIGCLEDHARVAHSMRSAERAACLNAATAEARKRLMLPRALREEARWQRECMALRELLGGAAFDTAWSEGSRWNVGEAIRQALSLADASEDSRSL